MTRESTAAAVGAAVIVLRVGAVLLGAAAIAFGTRDLLLFAIVLTLVSQT
jgi:hypothetical protein